VVVIALVSLRASASADAPKPGDIIGKFPLLEAGVTGGFSLAPIPTMTLAGTPDTHDSISGLLGPTVQLHVDARKFLFNATGTYNVVGGELAWMGRAEIVLGAGLGIRTTHNVIKSISRTTSGGYTTTTTEHYVHKHVPMLIGLSAGAQIMRANATSYTKVTSTGTMTYAREADFVPAIDIGFTLQSPQIALTVAPMFVPTTSSYGLHWSYGMAFPMSGLSMFFRFSGDHYFGDDPLDNSGRRLGVVVLGTLGIGSSMGVSR
jgi:hypothetical protein